MLLFSWTTNRWPRVILQQKTACSGNFYLFLSSGVAWRRPSCTQLEGAACFPLSHYSGDLEQSLMLPASGLRVPLLLASSRLLSAEVYASYPLGKTKVDYDLPLVALCIACGLPAFAGAFLTGSLGLLRASHLLLHLQPVVVCLLLLCPPPGLYTVSLWPPFSSHWDRSISSSMKHCHLVLDALCPPGHIQMAHFPASYFPSSPLSLAPGPDIPL